MGKGRNGVSGNPQDGEEPRQGFLSHQQARDPSGPGIPGEGPFSNPFSECPREGWNGGREILTGSLIEDDQKLWREHPNPHVDVIAVDITSLINSYPNLENRGADYSLFATPQILKEETITEGEEVLILGYPLGLFHTHIHSPLVRQGIVATKIGERIQVRLRSSSGDPLRVEIPGFLIDAAIIPGSSGSPVVLKPIIGRKIKDKVELGTAVPYLLGIVSATETTAIRMEGYAFPTLAGLGIVFDASTIQETIELFFPKERRP